MRHDSETILAAAIHELRTSKPGEDQVDSSARRIADRLGIDAGSIQSVSIARPALDWSAPQPTRAFTWRPRALSWALAPSFALLVCLFFVYRAFWQVPPGVRAEVVSIDGSAYRISDAGDRQLSPGDKLIEGEELRTSGGGHAVLKLADGSTVEVNERSVLGVGARGRSMTVSLDNGAVIVQAAKRTSGHLYVKTADCRVAVTGTVFSVNSGIKGSRIAVLQGSVHVTHAGADTLVHAGDQLTTSENLAPEPVDQQIAWSHDRDKYLMLLAQFDVLQHSIEAIPSPALRYSSDLLQRVPANTLLYVSIPNLGDFLSEANGIFQEQLKQSPALQEWWSSGPNHNTAELNALVEKLHEMSGYLGNEIVVVGLKQANQAEFAIIADTTKNGLDDFLTSQFPASGTMPGLVVFNETSLAAASASPKPLPGQYALVRQHEAVFSNSIATLKQINAQLNAGASGFATGDFGQQIAAAYSRGAGMILAADVHPMMENASLSVANGTAEHKAMGDSGIEGARYLIAEHRELNGLPENHLNLQFAGTRQGVASWLAAPAPIGSLEFVTPNAALAVAMLSKDPAAIADDIMAMATPDKASGHNDWTEAQEKLHIDIRNDLAANLGGDFLLSLDGPVLPTPAWKAVIEVRDSARLESTIERLVETVNEQTQGEKHSHPITIQSSKSGGQSFYSVIDVTSGSPVAQYTFAEGYMIVASDRALLLAALSAHDSGNSLARSEAFKALLPQDENANYSAVAYQNISPVLQPLLEHLSGAVADAVRKMAADARPTAICAWGKDDRIEAASNSRLFGFDFLTLQALLQPLHHSGDHHSGNNDTSHRVND